MQSGAVQGSEIAELASEMKRLRASVEALAASVQKLVTKAEGAPAGTESTVYITRTGKKCHLIDRCQARVFSLLGLQSIKEESKGI